MSVESGIVEVFDHIESEGPMWAGSGKRWSRAVVRFKSPFNAPPVVQMSMSMIDADSGRNLRLELHSEDLTPEGFTVVAHTWSDTRVGRLQVQWTAIGNRATEVEPLWDV
jgi:hypothetical protein